MRSDGALCLRPIAKIDRRELSPQQEVEDKGNGLLERQETLLAVYRASEDSLI
jgi:hypothetical protein